MFVVGGIGFIGCVLICKLVVEGKDVCVLSCGKFGFFVDIVKYVEFYLVLLYDFEVFVGVMEGIEVVYYFGKLLDGIWEECLKNDVGVMLNLVCVVMVVDVNCFVYIGMIVLYDMSDFLMVIIESIGFGDDMSDCNFYVCFKVKCEEELLKLYDVEGLLFVIVWSGIVVGKGGLL